MSVAENLERVLARIDAVRDKERPVRLVAVSKRQPDARLLEAYQAGHRDFGENYVQELVKKKALLPAEARWHMIGHVQKNKAKGAVEADLIHTIDSLKLGKAVDKVGTKVDVLVEVNVGGEASKAGVAPDEVEPLLTGLFELPNVAPIGLMCIPPPGEGRRHFASLRGLRDRLAAALGRPLPELSMGMSDDFEDAIREGATIVRVGTAIFGPRE